MRQRRRAERSRLADRSATTSAGARRLTERFQQRAIITAGLLVGVVVVALLIAGWYFGSYRPPRKVLADVEGEVVLLADVVPYTILEGTLSGTLDPRQGFNSYVRDSIFFARAADEGVVIAPEEVEAAVALRFEPLDPEDPEAPVPETLGPDGRENLERFIDALGINEASYRRWIEGSLYWAGLLGHFQEQVPATTEQVFLNWIVAENSVAVSEAYERVTSGESFADVAADLNTETTFADETGAIGWTPEGVFTEFDNFLFADDLEIGAPIGPLASSIGSVVLMVSDGPDEREVEEDKAVLVGSALFQAWMDVQTIELLPALPFTSDDAIWVLDRIQ